MNIRQTLPFLGLLLITCNTPKEQESKKVNLIDAIEILANNGNFQAVIEIPAGTFEKWEVDKNSGQLKRDIKDGKPRSINYLPYPANYGFIPQTILPKELGGDGDPLDIIVIGDVVTKGKIVECRPVGVLNLLDNGEQDDKIIAIANTSVLFNKVKTLKDLKTNYQGITEILELWFTNYKGIGQMKSNSFGSEKKAFELINKAAKAYSENKQSTLK